MSTGNTRLQEGTRVVHHTGARGTVRGYHRSSLVVACDGGGSAIAPAHFTAWRELTADELAAEVLAPMAPGSDQHRSFVVCPLCGFTNSRHAPGCAR